LIKILKKKWYKLARSSWSHMQYVFEDKTITVPVHANRDIWRWLLRTILKQAWISHEEFLEILKINN